MAWMLSVELWAFSNLGFISAGQNPLMRLYISFQTNQTMWVMFTAHGVFEHQQLFCPEKSAFIVCVCLSFFCYCFQIFAAARRRSSWECVDVVSAWRFFSTWRMTWWWYQTWRCLLVALHWFLFRGSESRCGGGVIDSPTCSLVSIMQLDTCRDETFQCCNRKVPFVEASLVTTAWTMQTAFIWLECDSIWSVHWTMAVRFHSSSSLPPRNFSHHFSKGSATKGNIPCQCFTNEWVRTATWRWLINVP